MANEVRVVVDGKDNTAAAFVTASARVRTFKAETVRALEDLNAKKLKIDADVVTATQKVDKLKKQADGATGDRKLKIDADIAAAEAKIVVMQRKADDLRKTIKLKAEADMQPAESALHRFVGSLSSPSFTSKFGTALKVGAVGGAAAVAGPLGNVFAGALIAGAGAGMIGAAALLQKDNPAVQAAGVKLGRTFTQGFREASAGMAAPLAGALDIFQRQLAADLPTIRIGFDAVAGAVEPLARGLAGLIHNALPGFISMLQQSRPVLESIAARLPELGSSIGDLFQTAAAAAPYAIEALGQLITVIEWTINGVRGAIVAFEIWSEAMDGNIMSVDEIKAAYAGLAPDLSAAAGGMTNFGDSAEEAKAKLNSLTTALLAQRADARGFQAAIDAATESLRENGKTLDIGTEKGRANEAAIDAVAATTRRWRDSSAAAGEAQSYQNAIMIVGEDRLINLYIAMGKTRTQAQRYARELLGLPPIVKTTAVLDTASAARKLNSILNGLRSIDGRTVSAYVNVETSGNVAALRGIPTARASGGIIGSAATGGARGNLTMVGEQGRELVSLPSGSMVHSNPDTERMLAGSGGGGMSVALNVYAPIGSQAQLEDWLQRAVDNLQRKGRL